MQEPSAVGRIVELVRDLRARCPWDAAQTPMTLRPYLVEEVFELDHAIAEDDRTAIQVELGDLLLHLAFQIVLAEERGDFGAEDLTRSVEEKMWRRHPHLFPERVEEAAQAAGESEEGNAHGGGEGETPLTPQQVWERRKLAERDDHRPSVLDGLPPIMPALVMAYRLQERAASVGFDWPDATGPLAKVREETAELTREMGTADPARVAAEVGDLLFAVVNLSRKLGCDPRAALERANSRFKQRFQAVEELAHERGIEIGRADLETLDGLWEEVKGRAAGRGDRS